MSRRSWRGLGLAGLALALAIRPAAAASQQVDLSLGIGSRYDSNLLEYSDDQQVVFERGTRPERFSIESLDDLGWNPTIGLTWELDQGGGRRHVLRLRGEGDFKQRNATADWRAASVSWREHFRGDRSLGIGWYQLPNYYLRQLVEDDLAPPPPAPAAYARAQFDLGIGSATWSQRLSNLAQIEIDYQYERRTYGPSFRERDSNTHQGVLGLELGGRPRRGQIAATAGYRGSAARGSDGDEIAGAPPDDDDVSYRGFVGGLNGRMDIGRRGNWRFGGDLGWELGSRHYESDRPADRYHYGRNDLSNAIEAGLRAEWRPHWRARGFYRFENNHAELGAAAPSTTDVGSYSDHRVGLALDWSATLWSTGVSP